MFVFVCPKCRLTDISDAPGGNCIRCGTEYIPLGIKSEEYNKLNISQIEALINEKTEAPSVVTQDQVRQIVDVNTESQISEPDAVSETTSVPEDVYSDVDRETFEEGYDNYIRNSNERTKRETATVSRPSRAKRITEGVSAQMFTQSAGNLIKKIKESSIEDEEYDDSSEIDAELRRLNWKRIGVILSMIHLLTAYFCIFVMPRLKLTHNIDITRGDAGFFTAAIGIVIVLVFAGLGSLLRTAKNIITLGGSIYFTIYGIPLMIALFFLTIILLPFCPLVTTYPTYIEEKRDFNDICDVLGISAGEAGRRVRRASYWLRIIMAVLFVCLICVIIWSLNLRMEADKRPSQVSYDDAAYGHSDEETEKTVLNNENSTGETGSDDIDPIVNRKSNGEVDGFVWGIRRDEIVITDYKGSPKDGVLKVPANIEQLPVTDFYADIFSGNEEIEEVVLPNSIQSIRNRLFMDCKNLKKIELPSGLTEIGDEAFRGCVSLESIEFNSELHSIGKESFAYCDTIESIKLPKSVETVGKGAFGACKSLKNVETDGVVTLGPKAFAYDESIEKVVLNEGLKTIGHEAFENCKSLRTITIPASVTELDFRVFVGSGLEDVTLLDGDENATIGSSAFSFTNVEYLEIPGKYTELKGTIVDEKKIKEVYWHENEKGDDQIISGGNLFNANENDVIFTGGSTIKSIEGNLNGKTWGKQVTIYGPPGSYLEEYAMEHDYPFVAE